MQSSPPRPRRGSSPDSRPFGSLVRHRICATGSGLPSRHAISNRHRGRRGDAAQPRRPRARQTPHPASLRGSGRLAPVKTIMRERSLARLLHVGLSVRTVAVECYARDPPGAYALVPVRRVMRERSLLHAGRAKGVRHGPPLESVLRAELARGRGMPPGSAGWSPGRLTGNRY